MHGQVALIERTGIGVGLAAECAFLRGTVAERGVNRRADAGGVVCRPCQLKIQPVIAVRPRLR